MERVNQAKSALALYGRSLEHNRQLIDSLAAKQMSGEQVRQFFLTCYTRDFGALDPTSREKREQRRMQAARDAFWKMDDVFSRSIDAAGATAWNAVNAYTEWLEHSRPIRVKNYAAKQEQRLSAKLFGVDADRRWPPMAPRSRLTRHALRRRQWIDGAEERADCRRVNRIGHLTNSYQEKQRWYTTGSTIAAAHDLNARETHMNQKALLYVRYSARPKKRNIDPGETLEVQEDYCRHILHSMESKSTA